MAIKKCQPYNNNNSMKDPVHVDHHVAHVKVVLNLEEEVVQNHQLKRSRIHALVLALKNQSPEAVIQIAVEAKVNYSTKLFKILYFY